MAYFMIEIPHAVDECMVFAEQMAGLSSDLMDKTEWGCLSGEHISWTVMEADNAVIARNCLPEDLRDAARIVEVNRLSLDVLKSRRAAT